MRKLINGRWAILGALCASLIALGAAYAKEAAKSSYSPVVIKEPFEKTMARMKAAKQEVMKRQMDLVNERYDLNNRLAKGVMMSGGREEGPAEFYENSLGICGVERKAYVTAFLGHLVNWDFAGENLDKIEAGCG
ncbi:MAG: hypothetical protein JRF30_10610 [Deltaproteobacteria bacterium]|nr:hypothetical protein [Deltaproteobacteria bacterium]MBW1796427.1 hypothetical protein [Deltaproteobacteria bacterium]MBW2331347.1 hypothetical protein [Deltaproteobacteria bacterium]